MRTDIQDVTFYVFGILIMYFAISGVFALFANNTESEPSKYHLSCPEREKQQAFMLECIKHSPPQECAAASNVAYCYSVKEEFNIKEIVTDKITGWLK